MVCRALSGISCSVLWVAPLWLFGPKGRGGSSRGRRPRNAASPRVEPRWGDGSVPFSTGRWSFRMHRQAGRSLRPCGTLRLGGRAYRGRCPRPNPHRPSGPVPAAPASFLGFLCASVVGRSAYSGFGWSGRSMRSFFAVRLASVVSWSSTRG